MHEPSRAIEVTSKPEFGAHLPRRTAPLTPRELFCALFEEPEACPQYLEAAFHFARHALASASVNVTLDRGSYTERLVALLASAIADVESEQADDYGSSWPVRLVREFAPAGLSDGIWLSPALLQREGECGGERAELLRAQVALRAKGARALEAMPQRYVALLASLGIPAQAISRWDFEEAAICADISYEHALLGMTLALFPEQFGPEIVGFNLWLSAVGPCPLLDALREELELRGAALRYFDGEERAQLKPLAMRLAELSCAGGEHDFARIARGFAAAHASYLRWQAAMRGSNIPYTPREFVLEGIRRKARFAIDHHHQVELKGHNLASLLQGGEEAHAILLDHLAETASLIRKGSPDRSPFMTHTLSLDGPMFDAFTAEEKNDLREWIASLGRSAATKPAVRERVPLAGEYASVAETEAFLEYAARRYERLSQAQLLNCLLAPERHPGIVLHAQGVARQTLQALRAAFVTDERLSEQRAPQYAEGTVATLLKFSALDAREDAIAAGSRGFLRASADVARAGFEEFAFLLARYLASPGGDETQENAALTGIRTWRILCESLSLNARLFVPELLGINLALELLENVNRDDKRQVSAASFAVHAFMGRVRESAPAESDAQWQRVFWALRSALLLARGTDAQRAALREALDHGSLPQAFDNRAFSAEKSR